MKNESAKRLPVNGKDMNVGFLAPASAIPRPCWGGISFWVLETWGLKGPTSLNPSLSFLSVGLVGFCRFRLSWGSKDPISPYSSSGVCVCVYSRF